MFVSRSMGRVAGSVLAPLAAAVLLALPAAPASAQNKPPAGRMYGSVQIDGQTASDGTVIVAHVNGSVCGRGQYDANRGVYIVDLDSSIDECDQADSTVWFSVGSCTAYQTGTVPEFSGAQEVDLQAPGSC
jgi:hypothetical protein